MAANVAHIPAYEAQCARLAGDLEAITAQVRLVAENRWPDNTGSGFEPHYNPTIPETTISTSEMNNFISTLGAVLAALEAGSANIAKIAGYDPDLLNPEP